MYTIFVLRANPGAAPGAARYLVGGVRYLVGWVRYPVGWVRYPVGGRVTRWEGAEGRARIGT